MWTPPHAGPRGARGGIPFEGVPQILPGLDIPTDELFFDTSRSSGPGGQNVNKVESRVTLRYDLASSPSLSDEQKALIRTKLATRVNREGVLRVSSQRHRTQAANRRAATERFAELLREALTVEPPRRATRVPRVSRRRRIDDKRRRADLKQKRREPTDW